MESNHGISLVTTMAIVLTKGIGDRVLNVFLREDRDVGEEAVFIDYGMYNEHKGSLLNFNSSSVEDY